MLPLTLIKAQFHKYEETKPLGALISACLPDAWRSAEGSGLFDPELPPGGLQERFCPLTYLTSNQETVKTLGDSLPTPAWAFCDPGIMLYKTHQF